MRNDKEDTILRSDAIEAISLRVRIPHDVASAQYANMAINAICSVPSADRPQGEWIDKGWKGDWQFETDGRGNCWYEYECSECGFHNHGTKSKYCPNCGCRMKGADDE